MPNGQEDLEAWLIDHQERTDARDDEELHPAVRELQELLDFDALLRMYFERMLTEVPPGKSYSKRLVLADDIVEGRLTPAELTI